ncbi:MAG: hypothetical protein J6V82_00040, partial [Clostridia bacterium]|nr:hypothetical protein [Clostridia bacterium]
MRSYVIIDGAPNAVVRYYLVFKITASENYQAFVGHYSFFITEKKATVTITSDSLDKAYDGKPVENPTFTTNSTATPEIIWKSGDAVCASAPTLPGVYTVIVSVPATENYTASSATMTVRIIDENGVCWDGSVASAFAGGNGTAESPYLIANGSQLAYLASLINNASTYEAYASAHYRLVADVFLNDGASSYVAWATTAPANAWTAIGKYETNPFKGTFDGNGHTIYGLYTVYDSSSNYTCGLFGCLNGATIENLQIKSSAAYSRGGTSTYSGILSAMAVDCVFRHISISESILDANFQSAAIAGGLRSTNDHVYFENCSVDIQLKGYRQLGLYVGRVLNSSKGKGMYFTNCVARGSLSAGLTLGGFVGDLIGGMPVTMKNCVNYASITATEGNAAGFITSPAASNDSGAIYLLNCMNFGDVFVSGGEAGGFFATLNMKEAGMYVENCANYGTVTVTTVANYAGGIVGKVNGNPTDASALVLKNVVCAGAVEAPTYGGSVVGGTASLHSPLLLENVYYPVGAIAVSFGKLSGATSVNLTAAILADWLNIKSAQSDAYLLWQMSENGPKLVSALRIDSYDLDRYVDGTPLQNQLYTVLAGDGKVTVLWYKDGVLLAGAPSAAGDYTVVVSIENTVAFAGSSVSLDVSLVAQGASTLRINDPSKVYDGTAVANPAIYTTNVGAPVTYTYYRGVYGAGVQLVGAPTDTGIYYVVVSVGAVGEYGAIQKYRAFEISPAKGQIIYENIADREYNGAPASLTGYTYNGTAVVSVTYYKGTYMNRTEQLAGAPKEVGRYVVVLTAAPEANFSGAQSYSEFEILPISTSVTLGVSLSKKYDGNPVPIPTYTATQSGGTITIVWKDAEGNALAGAPSAVGNYSVTVTLAASGNYAGASVTEHFEIWQESVWTGGMSASFAGGCGTESAPFEIATPEQLAYLAYLVNKAERYSLSGQVAVEGNDYTYASAYYKLTADLVMNENSASYKTWATFA